MYIYVYIYTHVRTPRRAHVKQSTTYMNKAWSNRALQGRRVGLVGLDGRGWHGILGPWVRVVHDPPMLVVSAMNGLLQRSGVVGQTQQLASSPAIADVSRG